MTGQTTAAAERSAHTAEPGQTLCHVCRRPMACSYAARVLPPLVQVCGAACAADARFSPPDNTRAACGAPQMTRARHGWEPRPDAFSFWLGEG